MRTARTLMAASSSGLKLSWCGAAMAQDAHGASLTTSLAARHALINNASLPITAIAASSKTSKVLVCDGRHLRLFSSSGQHNAVPLTNEHTAAILGAALEVDCIEIWTDVDGVMSADPRLVAGAFSLTLSTERQLNSHSASSVGRPSATGGR